MVDRYLKYMSLTWSLEDDQYGNRSIRNPSWNQVLEKLKMLEQQATGTVTLRASDNDGRTPEKTLNVNGYKGNFQIEFDDVVDGKNVSRFIYDETKPIGVIDLPEEDDWYERCVIQDFQPIYAMFKEFLETQSVTSPLLTWPVKAK
ncbi:hypothetical protein FZC33_18725 [Labrys sp. KNU-23]|uniref:DUF6911 family protein n=1 Tax=Labrys sp. KNU-23 TaxID=2789216 RepID=UPI0011EE59E2|nr:hypothetical protein [Labrys sp. KNU-23]QEN88212.1 hypothetical protein FZC33_18725 [Labrys sp. KNU-23]